MDGLDELDERKTKILERIIQNYFESGEPVGSRTISKDEGLNVSSATIRNEMSDLEEMGYIVQPHTSSGRIPTDKGYRFYVNRLMEKQNTEMTEFKELMIERVDRTELLLKQLARVLAANTNYATMISTPQMGRNKIKFIQLSQMSDNKIVAVIVLEGDIVKNKMIPVSEMLDNESLLRLNIMINSSLNGLAVENINLGLISKLKEQAGEHIDIVSQVLDSLVEVIRELDDMEIYTSGATNIFKYPELSDSERASELISALEEKKQLTTLLARNNDSDENGGIQVYIGDETPVQNMKDCSVVTATYELEEGVQGTIGIIGPKRMDYEKVVSTLQTLMKQLDLIYKKT